MERNLKIKGIVVKAKKEGTFGRCALKDRRYTKPEACRWARPTVRIARYSGNGSGDAAAGAVAGEASAASALGEFTTPKIKGQRRHVAAALLHEQVRHGLEGTRAQGAQGRHDRGAGIAMKLDDEGRQEGEGTVTESAIKALDRNAPRSRQRNQAAQVRPVPAQAVGTRAKRATAWFHQAAGANLLKVAFNAG